MTRGDLVRRATVMGLSLPAIGALLAACGGGGGGGFGGGQTQGGGQPKQGGTGRFGITVPAEDVDPVTMFNTGAIMTSQVAGEYLCFPDPAYRLQPRLATKWQASAAPKTWTFP